MSTDQELLQIVRESLGREPGEHEVGPELARIVRVARAATRNADRARDRWDKALTQLGTDPELDRLQRQFCERTGRYYPSPIARQRGSMDQAFAGMPVRVDDEVIQRSAFDAMSGIVGTPMLGGVPGVERNRDLYPYRARGLSYDAGEFYAFYRSNAIVREAVADILGVIAGATIEVQAPRQLTARAAELLGVDRDQIDRIADELNTELHLGRWNEGRGFAEMIQEAIRIAIICGADVHEFAMDPRAGVGSRILDISPRLPNTWMQWIQDGYGRPVAIRQTNPNGSVGGYGSVLDLSRCIHISIDQDGDNFEGLSMLRSARSWDLLELEFTSSAILHRQRFGAGVPYVRTSHASEGASDSAYQALATYANLSNAVLEIGQGVDVGILQMQEDRSLVEVVKMCTEQIRASMRNSLAGLGAGQSGAYNLGDIKSQLWLKGLAVFSQQIECGFNRLVRTYVDTYHGPQPVYPTMRISGFATRSPEEVIRVQTAFVDLAAKGVLTDVELADVAERAEVVWNGRAEEADEADEGADGTGTTAAAPIAPLQVGSLQAALTILQLIRPADPAMALAPGAALDLLIAAGVSPETAASMVAAQSAAPVALPSAEPVAAVAVAEEPAAPVHVPPAAAQQAAASARRVMARAPEKWEPTIAERRLVKAIAAGDPLSSLDLRMIEAYFIGAGDPEAAADWEAQGPTWQEWHAMGGQPMRDWVGVELDGQPDGEPAEPEADQRVAAKYSHIDFTPPEGVREAAKRALEVRETKPPSQRGMEPTGIARARDLANGRTVSPDTARRMLSFFERHEVDKKGETWDEQGKGWQAWHGWGGDAGFAWARKLVRQMDAADTDQRSAHVCGPDCTHDQRARKGSIQITVSGRGGGHYVTHRALTPAEQSVAWAEIQGAKDRTSQRLTRAIEREQRAMRSEFMALAAPMIEAGDVAGVAAISLDYAPRFAAAIEPILQSQGRWSSRDMRAEIRDAVGGRWTPETEETPEEAINRARASAILLAEQVQGRSIEDLRMAGTALASGSPVDDVAGAGVGLSRTSAALVVQAVSTVANAARAETATTQGPRIARAVYSAVMDRYTCAVCEAADGTVVEYGSDEYRQLSPPNPACRSVANSGANMCQCVWVYEYDTTPVQRSQGPEPRRVRLYVGPPGAGKSTRALTEPGTVVDRDAFVITPEGYRPEGRAESLEALADALLDGDAVYVTCALSASSRATLRQQIEDMGAVVECVEVTAPREWLRLVNEDRGDRQIPWDQWEHLMDAWEAVADDEFAVVERVTTGV